MTDDLATIQARHRSSGERFPGARVHCVYGGCLEDWPCDAAVLGLAAERYRAALARIAGLTDDAIGMARVARQALAEESGGD